MQLVGRSKKLIAGLHDMCKYISGKINCRDSLAVEIGTWLGDSAIIFAGYFKQVITIDPFSSSIGGWAGKKDMEGAYEEFYKRLRKSGKKNIILYRQKSEGAIKCFSDKGLSFVYIDGDHEYQKVKEDIQLYLPKIRKGGFLGGHDYWDKFIGVVKAVNESLGFPDKVFKDSSWVKRI